MQQYPAYKFNILSKAIIFLGLPLNETTIAEALKSKNYYSAIVGKWHLGVGEKFEYLPTKHGFDSYFVRIKKLYHSDEIQKNPLMFTL